MSTPERIIDALPDDIAAYLGAYGADDAAQAEAPPAPRLDHGHALRLMRWLQRRRAAQAGEVAAYEEEIRRLSEARTHLIARYDRDCEGAEALLAAYLRELRALDPKRKSVDLAPYGTVTSTTPARPPVRVTDQALLLRWVQGTAPEFLRQREPEVAWSDLKAKLAVAEDGRPLLDGAPVPGVESGAIETTIRVTPSKGGEAL